MRASDSFSRPERCVHARPITAFASSTVPYAATRGSSFVTRMPLPSEVSPESPPRVYIFVSFTKGAAPEVARQGYHLPIDASACGRKKAERLNCSLSALWGG